jgi:hypothetical protein
MSQEELEECLMMDVKLPGIAPDSITFNREQYEAILVMQEKLEGYRELMYQLQNAGLIFTFQNVLHSPLKICYEKGRHLVKRK